jgi:WhiB family redox-sensing transcriptional regulator
VQQSVTSGNHQRWEAVYAPAGDGSAVGITSTYATDMLISFDSEPVASPAEHVVQPGSLNGPADLHCCDQDPDLWFSENPAQLHIAKTVCAGCPARAACLAGAIRRGEPWGVWGGEIFLQGRVVAEKRRRGRPRKQDVAA